MIEAEIVVNLKDRQTSNGKGIAIAVHTYEDVATDNTLTQFIARFSDSEFDRITQDERVEVLWSEAV